MTEREALKLALEALDKHDYEMADHILWKALAQPEQEPVAWGMPSAGGGFVVDCITTEEHARVEGGYTIPLYTTPPQRTWVGLTDEDEINWEDGGSLRDLVKAIEAKLKEKNT